MNSKEDFIMAKVHEEMATIGQMRELMSWGCRLTMAEYQRRRGLLRRATDPKCELGAKLLWPFKDGRPLEWNWKGVEREGAPCESPVDISKLEFVPFHKDGEGWVGGDEMRRRSADVKAFPGCQDWSQHHAEDILERASELPEEAKQFVLVFADTVLLGKRGDRYVPCLVWFNGQWQLDWYWLGDSFSRYYRFPRLRKIA
jgi:hypothetical protein